MRYYVLRISGYRADDCHICKEWESTVNSAGGFPFGSEDIKKATSPDRDGRTHLFHSNCRCTLLLSPDGIPIRNSLDKKLLLTGALGHIYFKKKTPEERLELIRKHDDV